MRSGTLFISLLRAAEGCGSAVRSTGASGGIGEWLGVDPTIVRLAWVLLTLGWGTGVLLYAAFALALPVGISSVTETEK